MKKRVQLSASSKSLGRDRLDARLTTLRELRADLAAPHRGWLKAIRQALGMTLEDLANRLGITRGALVRLESSEQRGTIQLDTLQRVAAAMECDVAYVLIPRMPLQTMIDQQRQTAVQELNTKVQAHMALEGQEERDPNLAAWRTAHGTSLIPDRHLWKSRK